MNCVALRQLLTVIFSAILLIACSKNLTQEQFNQVQNGMTQQQVEKILGKPTETVTFSLGALSGTTATWKSKNIQIVIQFINDKVTIKNFIKDARQHHQTD